MTKMELVDALEATIRNLPARNCREIAIRAYLADHWRFLRLAVEKTDFGRVDTSSGTGRDRGGVAVFPDE
jgi:hypothetical protein